MSLTEIQHRFLSELNRACASTLVDSESFYLSLNPQASLSRLLRAVTQGEYLLESYDHKCVVVMSQAVLGVNSEMVSPVREVLAVLNKITSHPYFEAHYNKTGNLVVVELGSSEIDFCSSELQGLRHVYINAKGNIANALTHEFTHVLCQSGNRFLDEGLAMYMEEQINGSLDDFEFKKSQIPAREKFSDYRFAICSQAQTGVFLSDAEKYSAHYIEAYHAVRMVAEVLKQEALFPALANLRQYSSGLQQFDALSGFLESRKIWYQEAEFVPDPNTVEEVIIQSILHKQLSAGFEETRKVFYKYPTDLLSLEERVAWCRIWLRFLQVSLLKNKSSIAADLANISYLAQNLQGESCCQADYFLIQAQIESLRLQTTRSLEKLSEHSQRYYHYIAEAERLDPDCPRIIFESAVSDLHRSRQVSDKKVWQQRMEKKLHRLRHTPYAAVVEEKFSLQARVAG